VEVDDDAPDGDARGARAGIRSAPGGGSGFGGSPGPSGGSSSGGPHGGAWWRVPEAPEESRQAQVESVPPVVPSKGQVGTVLGSLRLRRCL
jgi:hypothetical protein